jgi:hypothetical protein
MKGENGGLKVPAEKPTDHAGLELNGKKVAGRSYP